jgi:hypothetical protein
MENLSSSILFFLITFILVFLGDYFLFLRGKLAILSNRKQNKRNKKIVINEINYLSFKFKIAKEKLYTKPIILWIAFVNSFIISLVSTVVTSVSLPLYYQLPIGFVLLFGLIYSLYEIFGRILLRKGY